MSTRLLLALALLALVLPIGCTSGQDRLKTEYAVVPLATDAPGLERGGLVKVWEQDLGAIAAPPKSEKRKEVEVKNVYLMSKSIIAVLSDAVVMSFDRTTGKILWMSQLPALPAFGPGELGDSTYFVLGRDLFTIDGKGQLGFGRHFPFSVSKPLLLAEDYIYAVSSDGNLQKVDLAKLSPVWTVPFRSGSVIMDTPVLFETLLMVGTLDGRAIGVDRVVGGQRLSMPTDGRIAAKVITDGKFLYFGSGDYFLYCFNSLGGFSWKAPLQGAMEFEPVLAGDVLYADVLTEGLYSVSKADGSIRWRNGGASAYLTTDGTRVFALAPARETLVIDADTAAMQTIVPVEDVTRAIKRLKRLGRQRQVFYVNPDGAIIWDAGGGEELVYDPKAKEVPAPSEQKEIMDLESPYGPVQVPVSPVFAQKIRTLPPDRLIFAVNEDGVISIFWKKRAEEAAPAAPAKPEELAETSHAKAAARSATVYTTSGKSELWVLDAANGRILSRLDASSYTFEPRNLSGDGLTYLVSKDGRILCLRAK